MRLSQRARSARTGFTLIEMLIAVVIAAIITALALPAYQNAVRKSRRAEATQALASMMQAQERYRAASDAYTADVALLAASDVTRSGYYGLSVVGTPTSTAYTVKAVAKSGTSQAADSTCAQLSVVVDKGQISYRSADTAGTANATDTCWPR